MSKIIKQVVGIDISKNKFDVCFRQEDEQGKITIKGTTQFSNDFKGFEDYLHWSGKRKKDCPLTHVMEATGVYYEDLCYFLHEHKEQVCVELPQKIKYFSKAVNQKGKTDKKDSKLISLYGLSFDLKLWKPISVGFKDIRDLSRLMNDLIKTNSAMKARLSALESQHGTPVLNIATTTIADLDKQVCECEKSIVQSVEKDTELKEKVERICKIKGVKALKIIGRNRWFQKMYKYP